MNRNSLFSTKHNERKVKTFSIDIEGVEHIFNAEKYKSIKFSGSFHGEYDLFFIVVDGDQFYNIHRVNWFDFESALENES